jgi:hypothetical protein
MYETKNTRLKEVRLLKRWQIIRDSSFYSHTYFHDVAIKSNDKFKRNIYLTGLHVPLCVLFLFIIITIIIIIIIIDRLCGLVVRVLGYRSGGPGSIPGNTRKKSSWSGTGSTHPPEYKLRSYLIEK